MGRTFFRTEDGKSVGNAEGVLPIPLYKGMTITIHGHIGEYQVVDWNYHHGHPDEDSGLRVILRKRE